MLFFCSCASSSLHKLKNAGNWYPKALATKKPNKNKNKNKNKKKTKSKTKSKTKTKTKKS
jgi:hypothetical protein